MANHRKRSSRKRPVWQLDGPAVLGAARSTTDTLTCWCGYSVTAEAVVAGHAMARHLASDPHHVGQLTPATHHIDRRAVCDSCTTRVFTFAEELDAEGRVTGRHYCAPCAARITNHHNNNQGETTK